VLAIEGDALGLHPAARPGAGTAEGVGVEGVTGFAIAEVHEHGLVRGAALLLEGALALRVVDRSRQEAAVVHRFPLRRGLASVFLTASCARPVRAASAKARDKEVRVRDFI
jgi:hypothetical protein